MNTTASYSSEHSWISVPSRRVSTETILSIQGKETDFVRDTSDTETLGSDEEPDLEYEPVTEPEDAGVLTGNSSGYSDNEIISTRVLAVSVGDDGELQLADSEQDGDDGDSCDSELDLFDYWHCAQCHTENNNPLYRYCEKCFKVRKNFFPPRPKRKHERPRVNDEVARSLSQDSGVETAGASQDLSQHVGDTRDHSPLASPPRRRPHKRRAESADRADKRIKLSDQSDTSDSDSETNRSRISKSADPDIKPLLKTISDPSLTIQELEPVSLLSKKNIANKLKEKLEAKDNLCIVCFSEPKSGVFVHGRIAHICCCYKCAVKVWAKAKRCPVCNCKVSNVLKAVVM